MGPPSSKKQMKSGGFVGQKSFFGPQLARPMPTTPTKAQTPRNHFMGPMMVSSLRLCQACAIRAHRHFGGEIEPHAAGAEEDLQIRTVGV
jgi:hypothetical protein